MAIWYYYDENGIKKGPFNSSQLRELASMSMIGKRTILETDTGQQGLAGSVEGLFSPHVDSFQGVEPFADGTSFCPKCGFQISNQAIICPRCGCRTQSQLSQGMNSDQTEIDTNLGLSIFVTLFCCFPLGIIAIIFSCLASSAAKNGNFADARSKANLANIFGTIGLILGILIIALCFVVFAILDNANPY